MSCLNSIQSNALLNNIIAPTTFYFSSLNPDLDTLIARYVALLAKPERNSILEKALIAAHPENLTRKQKEYYRTFDYTQKLDNFFDPVRNAHDLDVFMFLNQIEHLLPHKMAIDYLHFFADYFLNQRYLVPTLLDNLQANSVLTNLLAAAALQRQGVGDRMILGYNSLSLFPARPNPEQVSRLSPNAIINKIPDIWVQEIWLKEDKFKYTMSPNEITAISLGKKVELFDLLINQEIISYRAASMVLNKVEKVMSDPQIQNYHTYFYVLLKNMTEKITNNKYAGTKNKIRELVLKNKTRFPHDYSIIELPCKTNHAKLDFNYETIKVAGRSVPACPHCGGTGIQKITTSQIYHHTGKRFSA